MGQLFANSLVTGSIYVMMAVGFSILFTSMKFFNLAHGAIYLTGAYSAYFFKIYLGTGLLEAVVLGTFLATAIHVGIAKGVYFPMRAKGASMWFVAIASLGISIMLEASIGLIFGTAPRGIRDVITTTRFEVMGVYISSVEATIILTAFAMVGFLYLALYKAKLGKAIRTSISDKEVAQIVGINTEKIDLLVFTLGAVMAAGAGALMTLQVQLTHTMGHVALLKGIVVSILGLGAGGIGLLIGGLFLGLIENLVVFYISSGWRDGVALIILIAYILLMQLKKREYGTV